MTGEMQLIFKAGFDIQLSVSSDINSICLRKWGTLLEIQKTHTHNDKLSIRVDGKDIYVLNHSPDGPFARVNGPGPLEFGPAN